MTGGRIRRLDRYLPGRFMVTYGDGVADIAIDRLLAFHEAQGKIATVTAVRPPARFGALDLDGERVAEFSEKRQAEFGLDQRWFLRLRAPKCPRLPGRRRLRPGTRAPEHLAT